MAGIARNASRVAVEASRNPATSASVRLSPIMPRTVPAAALSGFNVSQ